MSNLLLSRIDAAAAIYGNPDGLLRDAALAAHAAGRPAFWSTSKYHNQRLCVIALRVNAGTALPNAFLDLYRPQAVPATAMLEACDSLVPLNVAAQQRLAAWYREAGRTISPSALALRWKEDFRHALRDRRSIKEIPA